MGWKETCAVDERMRFVLAAGRARKKHLRRFAGSFGVSRKTGYKWLARYRQLPVWGADRPFAGTAASILKE